MQTIPFNVYNSLQTEVGSDLKTYSGLTVGRSKLGVGKVRGRKILFHKDYWRVVLSDDMQRLFELYSPKVPFTFSCVQYTRNYQELEFIEYSDFDTAREPVRGRSYIARPAFQRFDPYPSSEILHHKWVLVDNLYSGFNVKESWEWSKQWLSVLTVNAAWRTHKVWEKQLQLFNLPCITEKI